MVSNGVFTKLEKKLRNSSEQILMAKIDAVGKPSPL